MTDSTVALGDVADFVNGVAFGVDDWGDEGRPIIRIQNLNDPDKPFNRTLRQVGERNLARHGDLLVSWAASLGVYVWQGEEGCINQHIFKVIPRSELIDTAYLRRSLEASVAKMEAQVHGATMKHITRDKLLGIRISLPSKAEQRRIAAILDKAHELRAKRREAIAKLDQLLQSMFLDMFGDPVSNPNEWPRIAFSELLDRIESGTSPVCLDRPAKGSEWAVLKLGAVTRCEFDPFANKALPPTLEPDPSLEVRVGDLLFSRKNTLDLVGACAFVSKTKPRLLLPDLIFRLCLKDSAPVRPQYLQALLTHPGKRKEVQRLAGGSAGSMPNISKAKLMGVSIELPPMHIQVRFEQRLRAIFKVRESFQSSLAVIDSCLASLQQRAFSGKV